MIDATTTALPQFISMLLAPMFMVSGAASMNWGLQRLQSMLTARIHKLNDERAELQNEKVPTAFSKMRRRQIAEQLQSMLRRARYTRNAIASFYVILPMIKSVPAFEETPLTMFVVKLSARDDAHRLTCRHNAAASQWKHLFTHASLLEAFVSRWRWKTPA
jgi:hypothetical protein